MKLHCASEMVEPAAEPNPPPAVRLRICKVFTTVSARRLPKYAEVEFANIVEAFEPFFYDAPDVGPLLMRIAFWLSRYISEKFSFVCQRVLK